MLAFIVGLWSQNAQQEIDGCDATPLSIHVVKIENVFCMIILSNDGCVGCAMKLKNDVSTQGTLWLARPAACSMLLGVTKGFTVLSPTTQYGNRFFHLTDKDTYPRVSCSRNVWARDSSHKGIHRRFGLQEVCQCLFKQYPITRASVILVEGTGPNASRILAEDMRK